MARARWGLVALALLLAATVAGAQPANDDCANATVIGALPFTDEVDTSLATDEVGEPTSSCDHSKHVWWVLPASGSDRNIFVDTFASSVTMGATVYPGTCGAFGPALPGCGVGDGNAAVRIPAGTTAYIQVGGHGGIARVTIDDVPEFLVTDDGHQYRAQAVAGSPAGRFIVAWRARSTSDLNARVYDGPASPVAGEMNVDPIGGSADADGRPSGGFVVTWNGSGSNLFARLLDDTGAPEGPAVQVDDDVCCDEPRVATDGAGNFVVAWADDSSSVTGPIVRRFDASGTPLGPEMDLGHGTDYPVDVGMDAAGNFVVAWWDYPNVFAQRFDAAGTTLGAPFVVNDRGYPPDYTGDEFAVAMAAAGDFIVAWDANDDAFTANSNRIVRARVFDSTGVPAGTSFVISDAPTPYYTKHRLRADDDGTGDFVVVWEDDGSRDGNGATYAMVGRRVTRAGAVGGPEFQLATANNGDQYDPNVAGGPNGEFMVVWNSYRVDEPWGSDYAVPARIFGSDEARYDSACAAAPMSGCTTPIVAAASSLSIRDQDDDSKDQLKWKLTKGGATTADDFGNPAQASLLGLCLYDAADALVFDGRIPPGGDCGKKPCWKSLGTPAGSKGYKFKNKTGTPDGIQKLVLKPGETGRTKIVVKGGKENLTASPTGFAPLPLALPARVQLQSSTGTCWEAVFDTATSVTSVSLRAKSAAP